jgi:hypothetical protein
MAMSEEQEQQQQEQRQQQQQQQQQREEEEGQYNALHETLQRTGWPRTDALVSDNRVILSTTAAYHLFSHTSELATAFLGVAPLNYIDKKTSEPSQAWYGIYWTPNRNAEPFRVYHCSKTEKWMKENGSEALPCLVRMAKLQFKNGKESYDPTFYPLGDDGKAAMKAMIDPAWWHIIETESKKFPKQAMQM